MQSIDHRPLPFLAQSPVDELLQLFQLFRVDLGFRKRDLILINGCHIKVRAVPVAIRAFEENDHVLFGFATAVAALKRFIA